MTPPKLKVCIVAYYVYPLFNPEVRSPFGGSEVRVSLLARELTRLGQIDVSFLVFDHGQPAIEQREGITFLCRKGEAPPQPSMSEPPPARWYSRRRLAEYRQAGNTRHTALWLLLTTAHRSRWAFKKGLSLLKPRPPRPRPLAVIGPYEVHESSFALFDAAQADVYLVPGNHQLALQVAVYCRARGKKYVFFAGSDIDCDPAFKQRPDALHSIGVNGRALLYTIANADLHIVQTDKQAELLSEHYGCSPIVLPNPIDLERQYPRKVRTKMVLWVGKSDWIKRPNCALDVAARLPDHHFVLVMSVSDPAMHRQCSERIRAMTNVELIEFVPITKVEQYFAEAQILLNTSVFEGFPNTFLQAAKYGVPIVASLVDPGKMLSEYGCGTLGGDDPNGLATSIERLSTDAGFYAAHSDHCVEYVRRFHEKRGIAERLERILLGMTGIAAPSKTLGVSTS